MNKSVNQSVKATPATDMAGTLCLTLGAARPHNLVSSRKDWAALLMCGSPANDVPARLASLYSLCGASHKLCGASHKLCARMAVGAARGHTAADNMAMYPQAAQDLQHETLREHVRRIGLDWSALWFESVADAAFSAPKWHADLRTCPLWATTTVDAQHATPGEPVPGLQHWLATHWLGMPVSHWLARWIRQPVDWLYEWSAGTALPLPQGMCAVRSDLNQVLPASAPLRVHADEAHLLALAADLRQIPHFSRHPLWQGACAETGTWTRLHQDQSLHINTPWLRWGTRLAELVRLSLADAPGPLGSQCRSSRRERPHERL